MYVCARASHMLERGTIDYPTKHCFEQLHPLRHLHLRACACMYVHLCVHLRACMHARARACVRVHACACARACVCAFVRVHVRACVRA